MAGGPRSAVFAEDLLGDRVVLVSGGGSGLGRATAIEMTACGAHVIVCGRRLEPLQETVELAGAQHCEAQACDIREAEQVEALVAGIVERHGRVDVLVNNAGGQFMVPAEDITPKGFRTVIGLNVEGTWLMTHAVATKSMIPDARGGAIINVTLSPHHGLPGMAHSSAARAAVENLTRELSIEWARYGIRLTAIAVGHFETEVVASKYPRQVVETMASTVPLQRLGRPEEVAWLATYLASPAAEYMSGSVVTIDGARDNWCGAWPPDYVRDESGLPPAEARVARAAPESPGS